MGESEKPNEHWWAQKGHDWYEECQRRRKTIPYYMIHEVFLSGYFSMLEPCKVLEFGCGFGRHLSYLRRIPGLDLYGCDQSPTMLAEAENLIDKSWLEQRTVLIPPRGLLPYPDKSFDVVYTASVLIHVRPEDVSALLGELLRVCRWHILHVENIPTEEAVMTSPQHSGCWAHPLASLYGELGAAAQTLPEYGSLQGAYRVLLDDARPVPDVTSFAGRLLETETNFLAAQQRVQQPVAELQTTTIRLLEESEERNQRLLEQQTNLTEQLAESTASIERQRAHIAQIESQSAQLEKALSAAQNSLQKREVESEDHRAKIADLQGQLAKTREALSTAQQTLQNREAELDGHRTTIADLQAQLAHARQALSAAQQTQTRRMAAESAFLQQLQQTLKA